MARPLREIRRQKLQARQESCAAVCRAVIKSRADDGTKRTALRALIRYATPKGVQRPGDLRTAGVAALDADTTTPAAVHQEHVVPVRVLVDRILAGDDPEEVLDVAVVAHVLREEHQQIGPLVTRHARLYTEMQRAPLRDLPKLGRRRYRAAKLDLGRVPQPVIPPGVLDR